MNIAAYSLAGAAFFVSIKPAPTNVLLALCMLSVLVTSANRQRLMALLQHPVAWGALAFFVLLCVSQLYSSGSWQQASDYLSKYARLAYIPFLAAAPLCVADARRVLYAFVSGIVLTVVLSYLNAYVPGFCTVVGLEGCGPSNNPFVFKQHITHGFFVALGAGLMAWLAQQWHRQGKGLVGVAGLYVLAALAAINVLLMLDGRTGWLVLLVFPVVVFYTQFGRKGLLLAGLAVVLLAGAMVLWVPEVQGILRSAQAEYNTWVSSGGVSAGRSGMRLTYYGRAIEAIAEQPWFGYGLGGVEGALKLHGVAGGIFALNNPHNQYLLFALQIGLVGLAVYLFYFWVLLKHVGGGTPAAQAFLLAFALGNLFNSFHFDMSEGVLFAIGVAVFWSGFCQPATRCPAS
ncbi:MAG TPA: O-antigen ligase family protein [Limnobacter sp.]|nr:O-antigen ligase family protein [Limnobacter sp.]